MTIAAMTTSCVGLAQSCCQEWRGRRSTGPTTCCPSPSNNDAKDDIDNNGGHDKNDDPDKNDENDDDDRNDTSDI